MDAHDAGSHHVPLKLYFMVWISLVVLTGVTVGAYYADLQHMAIFAALLIATVKVSLVLLYFMHIRYENKIFTVMILAVLATYGIFIALTFADYFYR